jgi:hypothetical protein
VLAGLRGMAPEALAEATARNAGAVLPRLASLALLARDGADPGPGPDTDNPRP